jgi:hypothetical protein
MGDLIVAHEAAMAGHAVVPAFHGGEEDVAPSSGRACTRREPWKEESGIALIDAGAAEAS